MPCRCVPDDEGILKERRGTLRVPCVELVNFTASAATQICRLRWLRRFLPLRDFGAASSLAGSLGAIGASSNGSPRRSVERSAATSLCRRELSLRAASSAPSMTARSICSRCSAELKSSMRFSMLVRLTWMSASRCALRSVSAAIFSSARASAVSRDFSVLVSAEARSVSVRARLLEILDQALARLMRGLDLREPLLGVVAADGGFHRFAVEGAHLLGAGDEVLSRFAEQAFGGGGARLQRVEPHVQAVVVGLMLFLGFGRAPRRGGRVRRRPRQSSPRPCRVGRGWR